MDKKILVTNTISDNVNQRQAEFYNDFETEVALNLPSKLWRRFRRRIKSNLNITEQVSQLQYNWIFDENPKTILEIGCYNGTEFTLNLIRDLPELHYTGIDLSTSACETFRTKLNFYNLTNRTKIVDGDVLEHKFKNAHFDVVYMNGVLHHFPDINLTLNLISEILKPNGCLITSDPMITNRLFRTFRSIYRPFQIDKDWEFPFEKDTFNKIMENFEIEVIQGFLGKGMYLSILASMPIFGKLFTNMSLRANEYDKINATRLGPDLWRCNIVVQKLRKNNDNI